MTAEQTSSTRADMIQGRLATPRQPISKQSPEERVRNFDETYRGFDFDAAVIEASRCIDCPSAPCMAACPVHNDIPAALMLLEQGDIDGAANKFRETSTLPEMCGRLCPQESLCEGNCVVGFAIRPGGIKHPPVAIGRLEAFVADQQRGRHGGYPLPFVAPSTGRTCAIVGSGPAGLTVAEELQKRGHQCTVYEAWPEPGGVLLYGIPNFKMRKEILTEKIAMLRALGVRFVNGKRVGDDIALETLAAEYDALFVGIGAWIGGRLGIEGEAHLANVYLATEYLVRGNLAPGQLPSHLQSAPHLADDVVVIGGGDTSMDCVRTAVRLGAKRVTCVYRRTEAEMLGRAEERRNAREEGVNFEYLTTPLRFIGNELGEVTGVELLRMELGPPDESGRRRPVPIEGSSFTIPAGTVVTAIGYHADAEFMDRSAVEVNSFNLVRIDATTHQTNVPHIFAGGDVVNGADLVVTAIADGQRAAAWMHRYLLSLDARD